MNTPMKTRSVEETIEIDAPIEAVWKALNDAEELTRWFPLEAGVNPDGSIWMSWGDDFRFEGKTDIVEPPHHLRSVTGPMVTEIFLESRGGQTHVRLVQSGFGSGAEWDAELDATRRGWIFQLRGLKHYLEVHRGTPRRVAWARRMHSLTREEAWRRLVLAGEMVTEGSIENLHAGDAYRIRFATGDLFEGVVYTCTPPVEFSGTVENLNRAFLRIQFDDLPLRGYRDATLWLSTYGVPEEKVNALAARWKEMLEKFFPGKP